jgi:hypothetical protein
MSEWKFRGKRRGCALRTRVLIRKLLASENAVGILLSCFKSSDVNGVCNYLFI